MDARKSSRSKTVAEIKKEIEDFVKKRPRCKLDPENDLRFSKSYVIRDGHHILRDKVMDEKEPRD